MDRVIANRLLFNIECFYDNTRGVLSISDVALCGNVEHLYVCLLTSPLNAFPFISSDNSVVVLGVLFGFRNFVSKF